MAIHSGLTSLLLGKNNGGCSHVAIMSLFLPKLTCKKDIDDVIKGVAEKVVVLRFGRDEDSVCLQLDEIVSSIEMLCAAN